MKVTKESIKKMLESLPKDERDDLLREFVDTIESGSLEKKRLSRLELLNNKQGECPHCNSTQYVKYGIDKGSQRYKCKSCKRNFTEYTGTWMAGLHKKEKIDSYLSLMLEEKTLDQIKVELKINKKTAFDWRHKILSSIENIDKDVFSGITESDETFFRFSEKGKKNLPRKGKKRGSQSKGKGTISDKVPVMATYDRAGQYGLNVSTMGRLTKKDIDSSIGGRVSDKTILCSDSHLSYKGFAIDNSLEHHSVKPKNRQFVKEGKYHVQHVNSMHNRLKKWINNQFWGVSSKYLQQYLNWFRAKEIIKQNHQPLGQIAIQTVFDIKALERYFRIEEKFEMLKNNAVIN